MSMQRGWTASGRPRGAPFIVAALRGEQLTIQGDGWQTRSFCYVSDTIDGLVRLMEAPDPCPGP